eukprot:gene37823-42839_t
MHPHIDPQGDSMNLKLTTGVLALLGAISAMNSAAAQDTIVKIGHSGPLSGPQAFSGKDNENGARLAVEELNAKPITVAGKKLKFELQSEDDQGDPKAGVQVAQKFIDSGIKYVVGPYNSGVAIPASRAYNDARHQLQHQLDHSIWIATLR